MSERQAIIITTINAPTEAVQKIARDCDGWNLTVVGDRKTPAGWHWPGVRFLSIQEQMDAFGEFASRCPLNHYTRKNVGYLAAMRGGAELIAETDDDNIPYDTFLKNVNRTVTAKRVTRAGWENIYAHFSDERIWPRGFPLENIHESLKSPSSLEEKTSFDCPVQQFLADGDPDVDAVYRLTTEADIKFRRNRVVISRGTFCPFNSQNTVWWPEAYPLLYLPAHVSFRMTDIWRSFVAQICLFAMGKSLAFCEATVYQVRNQHSLIRDFRDEIPGYLHNARIMELLSALTLDPDPRAAGSNLRRCYATLVEAEIVPPPEMELIDLWLAALVPITRSRPA